MNELYTPEAYFGRLEDLWIKGNFDIGTSRAKYWKKHPSSGSRWSLSGWFRRSGSSSAS